MADLEISVAIDARGTKTGADAANREIKSIGDQTEKTSKQVKTHTSAAATDINQIGTASMSAATAVSAAGAAISVVFAAIVAAAIKAAEAVVHVSRTFAEAGYSVHKMQQQTGFAAQTISALEMQFRRTKTSGDDFREGMKNLVKIIGDAANGSDEARAKLVRLGIDPQQGINDLDGTFKQVLQRIVALKNPTEQASAAMDAFGENGYKLLPFIKSFNGDIDGLIKKAAELGVVMSEDDVRAAVEFEKAFADVQESVRGLMYTFGREYMPTVKDVLDKTGVWFQNNKATIQDWATSSGNAIYGLIGALVDFASWINNNPLAVRILAGVWTGGLSESAISTYKSLESMGEKRRMGDAITTKMKPDGTFDLTPVATQRTPGPTGYFTPKPGKAPRIGGAGGGAPKITEEQKQAQDLQRTINSLRGEIEFFGQDTEVAALQQRYFGEAMLGANQVLFDQAKGLAANIDKLKADKTAREDAAAAQKKYDDALRGIGEGITKSKTDSRNEGVQQLSQLQKEIELGRELNDVDLQHIANVRELTEFADQTKALQTEYAGQVKDFRFKEMADQRQELINKGQAAVLDKEKIQNLKDQIALKKAVRSLEGDLSGQLAELNEQYRTGAEVTTVFRVEQELLKDTYKGLSDEQRQHILATAAQVDAMKAAIKAQEEAKRQYDEFRNTILEGLEALEGGAGNFFKWMVDRFRRMLREMVADWLASKFFNLFFKGGNSQIQQQNGQGGGILGGILNGIFGGGAATGPGGTPNWNPNAGGGISGSVGVTPPGGGSWGPILGEPSGRAGGTGTNIAGGGFFGSLKDLFKPSRNPITGKMNSQLAGTLGGIGAIASVVGGFIPGKWGNVVSMAGMGMSIGAMFGGGLGAAIGAGIGAIAGLFMGDPKKKRDKKEKMPQLEKGFTDAMMELRRLLSDRNALLANPDGIVAQAMDIRNQIKNGFGIQMESKKYQKIMKERIAVNLERADELIKQIKDLAEVYRAANDRERRMIPEFASGGFPRPGQVALVGERGPEFFVPHVAGRVISNAETQQILTGGGSDINVTVVVQQDEQGRWNAMAQTDSGKRIVARVVTDGFRNDEIKTARRAG